MAKKKQKRPRYHFRNLVFEGGGVKGIAYLGALRELDERGILPQAFRVGGTSAGAINAALLALGFGVEETTSLLWSTDFRGFMDESWGVLRDLDRLRKDFGWYKGDAFEAWIAEQVGKKTGKSHATFNDLERLRKAHPGRGYRRLYVITTNLSTGFAEVFSHEHSPRARIADAVRRSMSIPLFFASVRNARRDVYVDGGVLDNYPVKLFDREKYAKAARRAEPEYYRERNEALKDLPTPVSRYFYNKDTLGFRLDTAREIAVFRDGSEPPRRRVEDLFDYTLALVSTLFSFQSNQHLHSDDWQRTVYIDTLGVGTTDFDLDDDTKRALVASGRGGVKRYFDDWWDDPAAWEDERPPANRLEA